MQKVLKKNYLGENLAIGTLVIPIKYKKLEKKSVIDENLVNRCHGSKKKKSAKKVKTW